MSEVRDFAHNLRFRLGINTKWRFCQSQPGGGILVVPVSCTEEEWIARSAAMEVENEK